MARPKKVVKPPNKDGYYRVDRVVGTSIDGKPIKKAFRSRISLDDARKKADNFFASLGDSNIMFSDWATKWLWEYKEPTVKANTFHYNYRQAVENHLIPYFKHFKLKDISHSMIQGFFVSKQNYSEHMIKLFKITLSQIFDTAIANRLIDYSPMVAIKVKSKKQPKPKETFTYEEIEKIKEQAQTHRFGLYILMLLYTGLRASELCGLKWEDIDLKKGTLSVKRACTTLNGMAVVDKPKNANSLRTIPIPKALIETLKKSYSKGFILNIKGKPMSSQHFTSNKYNVFFNETGIRKLSPHKMRHTCGTLLYEKCHDVFAVQKFLGHSNAIVTSKTYVHENADDLRKQLFDE